MFTATYNYLLDTAIIFWFSARTVLEGKRINMNELKVVSREEFLAFIQGYPGELHYDLERMAEPFRGSYNDFSNGKKWPESVVATEWQDHGDLFRGYDFESPGKFWVYRIRATDGESI